MRPMRTPWSIAASLVIAALAAVALHAQVTLPERPYVGREQEIEEFLRTAEVVKYRDLSLGVTKPTRAWLAPGGPFDSVAWKPLRPGMYRGFYESYKSEIAAYEMDKALELHMVPPAVERKLNGISGAVIMWLDNMRMWRDLEDDKPATAYWNRQMVRMKMFDSFIGNIDRNAGNILVDENWSVYLIDHSRAFVPQKEPPVTFTMVDRPVWERMQALDEQQLRAIVGPWVTEGGLKGILARREKMARAIEAMVKKRGEARVFLRE